MNTLKNILILILTLFAVIPQGCVTGPDGITRMDPTAKALLSSAAKTASLVGLTFAIGEIPILQSLILLVFSGKKLSSRNRRGT